MSIPVKFVQSIHDAIGWNPICTYEKTETNTHADLFHAFKSTLYFVPELDLNAKAEGYIGLILYSLFHEKVGINTPHSNQVNLEIIKFELRRLRYTPMKQVYQNCSKTYLKCLNSFCFKEVDEIFHSIVSFLCLFYCYLHHMKENKFNLEHVLEVISKYQKAKPLVKDIKFLFSYGAHKEVNALYICETLFSLQTESYHCEENIKLILQIYHLCNSKLYDPKIIFKQIIHFESPTMTTAIRKITKEEWGVVPAVYVPKME